MQIEISKTSIRHLVDALTYALAYIEADQAGNTNPTSDYLEHMKDLKALKLTLTILAQKSERSAAQEQRKGRANEDHGVADFSKFPSVRPWSDNT